MESLARVLRTLTGLANRVLLAAASVAVLWDVLLADEPGRLPLLERALAWAAAHPTPIWIGAVVLLVLELDLVGFAAYCLMRSPERAYIVSRAEGGRTRVALAALERALQAAAQHVPNVSKAKVRVRRTGRHRYRVHVRYRVADVARANQAAEALRQLLRRRLGELVVLDAKDRVEFDLDLQGLERAALRSEPPRRLPRPAGSAQSEHFRGPVYEAEGDVAG